MPDWIYFLFHNTFYLLLDWSDGIWIIFISQKFQSVYAIFP